MTLAKLKDLKTHIEDRLDKGSNRPSVSPWGASVLFMKNKEKGCCGSWLQRIIKRLGLISI